MNSPYLISTNAGGPTAQTGAYNGLSGQNQATAAGANIGADQSTGQNAAAHGQSNGLNMGPVMNSFMTINNAQMGQPQVGARAFDRSRRESCGPAAINNQANIGGQIPPALNSLTAAQ